MRETCGRPTPCLHAVFLLRCASRRRRASRPHATHAVPPCVVPGVEETRFTMEITNTSALATVDPSTAYTGSSCCGGYSYWLVPDVPGDVALSVNLTVISGALHALFLQVGAAAIDDPSPFPIDDPPASPWTTPHPRH